MAPKYLNSCKIVIKILISIYSEGVNQCENLAIFRIHWVGMYFENVTAVSCKTIPRMCDLVSKETVCCISGKEKQR